MQDEDVRSRIPWQPLLHGVAAERAKTAAQDIVTDVGRRLNTGGLRSPFLDGAAGRALLFGYVSEATGDSEGLDCARALQAFAVPSARVAVSKGSARAFSLFGAVGAAWVQGHLARTLELEGDDESILIALANHLRAPWRGHHDLISGLTGVGLFVLGRLGSPLSFEALDRILDHFGAMAAKVPNGVTWYTPRDLLTEWEAEQCVGGVDFCNLGVAHGVPGVIAFLGQVCALKPSDALTTRIVEKAQSLLVPAMSWLLARPWSGGTDGWFPRGFAPRLETSDKRHRHPVIAWCYGDLGIAAAILVASRGAREPRWADYALDVARRVAEFDGPLGPARQANTSFCHGHAGVAHIFNRLAQETGDPILERAAVTWFERTLDRREEGTGAGGYKVAEVATRAADDDMLLGATGVALALLGAISDVEPNWDRLFLISGIKPG